MADVPSSAKVVVIGAGIVGNSLVWHLARLGWRDIVQIDKGPLPNPGGSTGHASNFIFLVDHSREMTDLTLDSVAQYQEMGVFTQCGGIEVARVGDDVRMNELRRKVASGKAFVFFCAGGWRSALATKTAQDMGLAPVKHILGGFTAWREAGLPVEAAPKKKS